MRTETLAELRLTEYAWVENNATILAICDSVRSECLCFIYIEKIRKIVRSISPTRLDDYQAFLRKVLESTHAK